MADLDERIHRYVERKFRESGNAEWPTVRQVARAMRCRQGEVIELCDGYGPLMKTEYFVSPPDPVADHFVESTDEKWR